MKSIIIKNIDLFDGESFTKDACLLIEGDRIAYSGAARAFDIEGAEIIDGKGGLCMPGLSNAHTHSPMTLLRGVGSDLRLQEWLERIWPLEDKLDSDAVYWGTTLAAMEMTRRGITGFADMYMFIWDVARAVVDAGMRANLSRPIINDNGARLGESVEFVKTWNNGADGRIKAFLAIHAEYTSGPEQVKKVIEAADAIDAGIHVHISETDREVAECFSRRCVSPVQYFNRLGLFERHVLAAHCVSVDAADIETLAARKVWVAHNPISNLKLASGVAPVADMLCAGVNVALGTDSVASNNQYDMFAEMRMAAILQKGMKKDPSLMPVSEVLKMGTVNGARAMGFDDTGLLIPGMKADLILLGPDAENLSSAIDPLANIVYSAQGLNVRLTMADGRVLYKDGEFKTIDAERALGRFREAQARVIG